MGSYQGCGVETGRTMTDVSIEPNGETGTPAVQTGRSVLPPLRVLASKYTGPAIRASIEVTATVLAAWMIAPVVWGLVYGPQHGTPPNTPVQFAAPASAADADMEIFARFNPFDRTLGPARGTATQTANADTAVAPETSLKLTLFGLRMEDGGSGSAIIQKPNGQQGRFSVGDSIIDGVRLRKIHPTWVEITREGRAESLFFKGDTSARRRAVRQNPAAQTPVRAVAQSRQAATGAAPTTRPDRRTPRLTEDDIHTLFANTAMEPRLKGNTITGWTLSPQGSDTVFRTAGLEAGDVLVSINGVTLTAPEDFSTILDQLKGAERLDMLVEREGAPQTLRLRYEG